MKHHTKQKITQKTRHTFMVILTRTNEMKRSENNLFFSIFCPFVNTSTDYRGFSLMMIKHL